MNTWHFERFQFRQIRQEHNESIDVFVTRLRDQARKCSFFNVDEHIKNQIIEKCAIEELRQRVFENEMSLNELINMGKTLERAQMNNRIEPSRNFTRTPFIRTESRNQCCRCGFNNHDQSYRKCPAKAGTCNLCKKPGHFARMCFNLKTVRARSRSPLKVSPVKVKAPTTPVCEKSPIASTIPSSASDSQSSFKFDSLINNDKPTVDSPINNDKPTTSLESPLKSPKVVETVATNSNKKFELLRSPSMDPVQSNEVTK